MTVHHIGYLVKDMDYSIKEFQKLGYELEGSVVQDKSRKISIQFMVCGMVRIELIVPDKDNDFLLSLRKRIGNAPYHICYETDKYDMIINEMTNPNSINGGYIITQESAPAVAIRNKRVTFLYNSDIGLIEILEK